jgi:hypothetical protein
MQYEIIPIYERGVRRDWKVLDKLTRISADIHIRKDPFGPLGRESLTAYLHSASLPMSVHQHDEPDDLPPLWDVRLEGMATLAFVIEGVEFIDGRMYQQAWHCKVSDHKIQVPWTMCPRSTLNELI